MLEIRLLGKFEIKSDGKPVPITSRPAQSLFAILILSAGTAHRREKLAGLLWPDSLEETARDNLRHALWRVRKALPASQKSTVEYLLTDDLSIAFNASAEYWLDAVALEKVTENASADELIAVLSEYHGELLPGFYDEWVVLEREHLNSVFENRMTRLLALLDDENRWKEVLEWGERWIKMGQKPEPAYRALMTAHAAKGDMSKVAATYERCVKSLKEFGIEPSEQTKELYENLKSEKDTPKAEPVSTKPVVKEVYSNIPVPLTSFIGREKDLKEITRLLSSSRLLTLTGPGGVGKTRLAIQISNKLLKMFKDGVWWVELAPLRDEALVSQAVAQVLGVRESPNQTLTELLKSFLRQKQLLLILDNCEHLIAACAHLADTVLGACPNLKILSTSREALGIPGEWLYSVPVLDMPKENSVVDVETISEFPALVLFAERARAVRSDFSLNALNIRAVASICTQLAGLPLAIELIAAHVKTLSLEQIAARLDDRFALLTGGSRIAPSRQQTLRATLDWSYDLLTEVERELFRQLSVFVGGFTLEALESVAQLDSNQSVFHVLSRLVDKSLVIVEQRDNVRYHLLDTIRQYAAEKLQESGDARWSHDRHLAYFLMYAEKAELHLFSVEQRAWANRLEIEHDNLRAALRWSLESDQAKAGLQMAGALAWFWHNNGYLREGSRWLEKMLTSDHGVRGTERAKALRASSMISRDMGDYIRAKALADSSVELYREIGDNRGVGLALIDLGATLHFEGKQEEAIESFEESLRLLRATGERWGIAYALVWLGDTWFRLGDIERAATQWEESLRLTRELGDNSLVAWSLGGLGDVARLRLEYNSAIEMFKEALTIYRELGNKSEPPFTLEVLGLAAAALGMAEHAARLWGAASAWREAINEPLALIYQRDYAPSVTQARIQLGDKIYESAWSEGHGMSPEQAIALALEE